MTNEDLKARLRQLSGNTGKMTWVGDKPMTASDALTRAADHIEKLEAELDRCRKSNVVMDNTVRELEADNARLRDALEIAIVLVAAELPYAPMLQHLRATLAEAKASAALGETFEDLGQEFEAVWDVNRDKLYEGYTK